MNHPDPPIDYIARTHAWYGALGYPPYRYAHFDDVPFAPLGRPLAEATVALLTTAAPYRPELGDQGKDAPYNAAAKFYAVWSGDTAGAPDLRVSHVAVDRAHLSDDQNCWFPLPALKRAAAAGRIGAVSERFHGVPTNRSQRHTLEVDAPDVLARLREDRADAAVLVANCPVCHQSMTLVARVLEAAGIATVVVGAAKDVVEHVGAPRFLFSDVPLGNAAGLPGDVASQDLVVELALRLLADAVGPRTTVQTPLAWPVAGWKRDYMNLEALTPDEIARRRAENEAARATAGAVRAATLG
ncbi:glycine/sarcosine/betaine reductase selenoprotein B family protein [Phenylobacterium sp.]|uniref:glycine/sarcosine/betaine reductase selenoprotein B family protein n=1 Tax=Phenylobacterium sp. TaxID=1871053 RepID=UPI002ED9B6F2